MSEHYTRSKSWILLYFLMFLNLLNFLDRQLVSTLGAPISRDLDMTNAELGLLVGLAFSFFYTCVGVFMGTIADRWNRPHLIAVGLTLWSGMTAVSGLARNFMHLFSARLFVGIGEATLTPSALSMLSDVFKPKDRALASGIYYAGIPLGAAASMLVAGEITGTLGYSWRANFYVLGLLGVVLASVVWKLTDPERGAQEENPVLAKRAPKKRSTREIFGELVEALRSSPALVLTLVAGIILIFGQGALNFLPKWIMVERGFSQAELGRIGAILIGVGGMLGAVAGGKLSDICHRFWKGGRLYFLAIGQLVVTPFFIAFLFLPPEGFLFYFCWFVGSTSITLLFGPVFASVQDLVPARIRSTIIAFLIFCINLFGTAAGSYATGVIADREGLSQGMIIITLSGLLACPLFFWAGRRYSGDIQRLERREAALG